jgi:hypothetical protein
VYDKKCTHLKVSSFFNLKQLSLEAVHIKDCNKYIHIYIYIYIYIYCHMIECDNRRGSDW